VFFKKCEKTGLTICYDVCSNCLLLNNATHIEINCSEGKFKMYPDIPGYTFDSDNKLYYHGKFTGVTKSGSTLTYSDYHVKGAKKYLDMYMALLGDTAVTDTPYSCRVTRGLYRLRRMKDMIGKKVKGGFVESVKDINTYVLKSGEEVAYSDLKLRK